MVLKPYKFIVKAVPQVVDYNGDVIGEEEGVQPVSLFGCEQLEQWARDFPDKLDAATTN